MHSRRLPLFAVALLAATAACVSGSCHSEPFTLDSGSYLAMEHNAGANLNAIWTGNASTEIGTGISGSGSAPR